MTPKQIYDMAQDAGSIDSEEVIMTFANAIRSATKEEDAGICEELKTDGGGSPSDVSAWEVGTLDCAIAIRASK